MQAWLGSSQHSQQARPKPQRCTINNHLFLRNQRRGSRFLRLSLNKESISQSIRRCFLGREFSYDVKLPRNVGISLA
jgi:hypothetical protein